MSNSYGIDMGTNNLKIYSSNSSEIINVKNTIAIVDKDQMYAYGDDAYSMYEKAPETIAVSFPIVSGVIADFDNMQTMLFEVLEKKAKARIKGSDIVVAVPTDITEVEKKAFYDMFAVPRPSHTVCFYVKSHWQMPLVWIWISQNRPVSWSLILVPIRQRSL